ncbi:hypothetical protein [Achromobacter xylosoxidans]|uniref:hypothetical protein n=1 Tax=Alcaligenes xylosoxydans xylosoxydans TaxID=85698 RepID=UPI00292F908F|nr:hypothetical protein [Achromobacter xylosoxidans]WOB76932.1 hypothetical protein PZA07_16105 [Achromobacter xylosoxidans]
MLGIVPLSCGRLKASGRNDETKSRVGVRRGFDGGLRLAIVVVFPRLTTRVAMD